MLTEAMQIWFQLRIKYFHYILVYSRFSHTHLGGTKANFVLFCGQLVISGAAHPVGCQRATELRREAPQSLLVSHKGCKDGAICAAQAIAFVTRIRLLLPHLQLRLAIEGEHVTH